jgi:hypothetical protein
MKPAMVGYSRFFGAVAHAGFGKPTSAALRTTALVPERPTGPPDQKCSSDQEERTYNDVLNGNCIHITSTVGRPLKRQYTQNRS